MMVVENFKNSLTWADSVSMKVDSSITPKGIPGKGPWKLVFIFNRDHDSLEWNGNGFVPDSNGNPAPDKNAILRVIITSREFISVTGNPGFPPLGAVISTEFKEKKESLLDADELGGPLFGRTSGSNHKSIADLLGEAGDIHLRQEQEDINGISCYVLEGTTKYGKVTAWVAPEKGYAALKWAIEKAGDDFLNDVPMSQTQVISWSEDFNCTELEQVAASFVPKTATFEFTSKLKDGSSSSLLDVYKVSDIRLSPDFNALGAFKIDLPEGTRVTVPESPGIRYVWRDGKAVPDVNGLSFGEIDKTIDELKQQQ